MKTFVCMISKQFLATHPRRGQPTHFREKIFNAHGQQNKDDRGLIYLAKLHTIRDNYEYWARIADEVNAGRGILSLRQWTGSPYNFKRDGSKPKEFMRLTKMGVQKLERKDLDYVIDGRVVNLLLADLAQNDGLSSADFKAWFKGAKKDKPMAIIHFTEFRY